jgi:hypothetical protein
MIVTCWKNGTPLKSGAGYGLRINHTDTVCFEGMRNIVLTLEGSSQPIIVEIKIKKCAELRKKEIGKWLIDNGLATWPWRKPPKLCLEPISGNMFRLHK